ncbi:alpha/beta hydrolase-fold protein [Amycolatopsis cynarae]|uniref:Alpha/beta hydrolase-fold protein n=1 Tax=Amycolatopsis cynarae TaxID=2995223 RepID=A0ABY7BC74_9PSEU|nr:alpha/beta hydrolase-fold protein [Amycolatopsis sp. HUAS 11-8]WAL68842.1 alpha/beta hydrolase-fold protein [Amycolatopsis sp. HUAS 11-8]
MVNVPIPSIPDEVLRHARKTGPLESHWIWITCIALALALMVVAIRVRPRRRAVIAAMCCALLAAVTGINSYAGYVRTLPDLARLLQRGGPPLRALGLALGGPEDTPAAPRPLPTGPTAPIIERLDIADPANAVPSGRTYVLLPPGYTDPANANRRYPVVYLVHGYPYGSPEDWLAAGDAPGTLQLLYQYHALAPMIMVNVDLTAGQSSRDWEGLDVPSGPRLETYLSQTVVTTIDHRFRTLADRRHRALGGMSGGAFAALNIGLHHLDEFTALLLTLPYDALGDGDRLLGGNPALLAANTPRDYLRTMTFPHHVAVLLTAGTGARTDIATATRIADALHDRGQAATVHIEQGFNHTWHTARATLPHLLVFADQVFAHGAGP